MTQTKHITTPITESRHQKQAEIKLETCTEKCETAVK